MDSRTQTLGNPQIPLPMDFHTPRCLSPSTRHRWPSPRSHRFPCRRSRICRSGNGPLQLSNNPFSNVRTPSKCLQSPTASPALRAQQRKPAAAWLFAPERQEDLVLWTKAIREAIEGKTKIWIRVGTVAMAVELARSCKPDVLLVQGSDAGGHGLVMSSCIISLLPECADTFGEGGFRHIPLIAAGGGSDGRDVAAVIALGASGVCLGTRFLASPEAVISKGHEDAVLKAKDGAMSTARTSLYDRWRGTPGWPKPFNARGILKHSFSDYEEGMSEAENTKLYEEAVKMGDAGWGEQGRMTTYAGTGVGLVHKSMPASKIIAEVLRDSKEHLAKAHSRL